MNNLVLLGNPNVGKTTLFNSLTNLSERTGNYHGVTVDIKKGKYNGNGDIFVYDLPGIYSFPYYSGEEKLTQNFIEKITTETIVLVIESKNFLRIFIL